MKNNIIGLEKKVIKFTFIFNVVLLIMALIYDKSMILKIAIINIILIGTFIIIDKYKYNFLLLAQRNKGLKILNDTIGDLRKWESS